MRDNPYQGVGQVAEGARLVVREEMTQQLLYRWRGERPGNVSLRGSMRVGKTSLVRHALAEFARDNPGHLLVSVSASGVGDGVELMRSIAKRVYQSLLKLQLPLRVQECEHRLAAAMDSDEWFDVKESVADVFEWLADQDLAILLVIDEFDRLSNGFSAVNFQFLRDLASEAQYTVGLTTISRRSVYEIEVDGSSGSILGAVLGHSLWLGLMTNDEASQMISRSERAGISLEDYRQEILAACGSHPYLIDIVCYGAFESLAVKGVAQVSDLLVINRSQFTSLFRSYLSELRRESHALVLELMACVTESDGRPVGLHVEELSQRALVAVGENGLAVPFCQTFAGFLSSEGFREP